MLGKLINFSLITLVLVILPVTIFMFTRQQNTTQQAANLYNCDINFDHKVNNSDYQALMSCVQQENSCQGIRKLASDLNNDGVVDEKDVNYYFAKCQRAPQQ